MSHIALLDQQGVFSVMTQLTLSGQGQQSRLTGGLPQGVDANRVFHGDPL
jgi:hypothetical protein